MTDRNRLDEIRLTDEGSSWWNPEAFAKRVQPLFPPELEILLPPPEGDKNYNCFLHALGLSDDADIVKDSGGFLQDTFFQKMIDLGELSKTDSPEDGDYVAYQDLPGHPNMITHVGIVRGDSVASKWAWGPLVKHDLWDVPNSYGHTVWYVKSIPPEGAKALYWKYRHYNVVSDD